MKHIVHFLVPCVIEGEKGIDLAVIEAEARDYLINELMNTDTMESEEGLATWDYGEPTTVPVIITKEHDPC